MYAAHCCGISPCPAVRLFELFSKFLPVFACFQFSRRRFKGPVKWHHLHIVKRFTYNNMSVVKRTFLVKSLPLPNKHMYVSVVQGLIQLRFAKAWARTPWNSHKKYDFCNTQISREYFGELEVVSAGAIFPVYISGAGDKELQWSGWIAWVNYDK